MKKVGICGFYGDRINSSDGQSVKTRLITEDLKLIFGEKKIYSVDTNNWKKKPLTLFFNCLLLIMKCKNVIIMPAHNGIKIFTPLFLFLNNIFNRKIHYIVIGGWLPDKVENDFKLRKQISRFSGIYVETSSMKNSLEALGLKNIYIMNNYKNLKPIEVKQKSNEYFAPYKICYFSRMVYEKGIEDAVHVVKEINKELKQELFYLDLYGQIDKDYKLKFEKLKNDFPSFIKYCGVIEPDKTVNIIKDYFIQIFPTKVKTEGIPGSIIDSYYAGVPILASKWNSFHDVIEENQTGLGYEFSNISDLKKKLLYIADNPQHIIEMKGNCVNKSQEYSSREIMKEFIKHLN